MKPIEKAKSLWEHLANKHKHTHHGKHELKDLQINMSAKDTNKQDKHSRDKFLLEPLRDQR